MPQIPWKLPLFPLRPAPGGACPGAASFPLNQRALNPPRPPELAARASRRWRSCAGDTAPMLAIPSAPARPVPPAFSFHLRALAEPPATAAPEPRAPPANPRAGALPAPPSANTTSLRRPPANDLAPVLHPSFQRRAPYRPRAGDNRPHGLTPLPPVYSPSTAARFAAGWRSAGGDHPGTSPSVVVIFSTPSLQFNFENTNREGKVVGDNEFGVAPSGLFPRPWSGVTNVSDGGPFSDVIKYFVLLGQFVAKAIKDGRILDIPLSPAFYKVILDEDLGIYDIQSFDLELGRTLLEFQALVNKRRYLSPTQVRLMALNYIFEMRESRIYALISLFLAIRIMCLLLEVI